MRVLALSLSFIGLISALPHFYSPATSYGIKPFVYFGRGYGHVGGRYGGYSRGYSTGYNSLNYIRGSGQIGGRFGGFQNPLTFIRSSTDSTSVEGLFTDASSAAEAVKNTLVQLAANPSTAAIANNVLASDNSCGVNNVDDGVARIEKAIGDLDGIKGDVEALYTSVKAFIPLKDPVKILRKTSELVKLLQPLYNNDIDNFDFDVLKCVTDALRSSNRLNPIAAAKLNEASGIISAVTSFMDGLRVTTARLENSCTEGKLNTDFVLAIGDLTNDIADLYVAVGDAQTGEKIRQGSENVGRITGELDKIQDLDLALFECNDARDLSKAASTLENLADLIEEVGLENLQETLGIDVNFFSTE